MANADLAMYDAKHMGRNRWVRYKPAPHARPNVETLSHWAERIDEALRDDGLALLAQPIISLQPAEHTLYELVLRMHDAHTAAKEQANLAKSAERTGRIREIDRWVAWRAIEILAEQRDRGNDIRVAIKVSDQTISDDAFIDLLEQRVSALGVPPERLMIAVSEAAVVAHIRHAVRFTARAAKLGCVIALDDFGAGSGSLYHIKQLCFDYLTIDDEFVQHCVASEADRIVISTIVKLAGCMGKGAIAKGIPDAATLDVLTALGVAYGQGVHIGRPVPLDALLQ
jgi:EAL domain-containing protein (putative c-di-GMP-specific phosphodiesterase class I)